MSIPDIRRRDSVLLRQAVSTLRALLPGQITLINNDLATESAGYRLPTVTDDQINFVITATDQPTNQLNIKVEVAPQENHQRAAGRQFTALLDVIVTVEVLDGDITTVEEGGNALTSAQALVLGTYDLTEAVWRALMVLSDDNSLVGNAGAMLTDEGMLSSYLYDHAGAYETQARSLQGQVKISVVQDKIISP